MHILSKAINNISQYITSENNFQDAFGGMRGIDHFVKNRGKARVMLQIGAGHSNNCQVKLKLFGYDIQIQFQANLEVSEALITYVTNRGGGGGEARRRVMDRGRS